MTHGSVALGPGKEFDRIRAIVAALGVQGAGIGDDCAVVPGPPHPGDALVVSTDASVEGVHFLTTWLTPKEIGWRATAAALSDLAAAGARPAGVVIAVVTPAEASEQMLVEVMAGAGGATAAAGAVVLGGDLCRGMAWHLAVTVLGWSPRVPGRGGATPGDRLWVTGSLGDARAALITFRAGRDPEPRVRRRFTAPDVRIPAGLALAAHGATAMLDLSDGLAGDVGHLAAASAVGVEVDLERLPVQRDTARAAEEIGIPPARFAAMGGEDYELLAAMPSGFSPDATLIEELGVPLTEIGRVTPSGTGVRLLEGAVPVMLGGFDHFA